MSLDNYSFLSVYGTEKNGKTIKLVIVKDPKDFDREKLEQDDNSEVQNDEKFDSSISRARSKIWELSICNDWDFFFTITINPNLMDRFDLNNFHLEFTKFLYEYKHRKYKVKYLIIPEKHKDGAWHFHGLLAGLPVSELIEFRIGMRMSKFISNLVYRGRHIYFSSSIQDKFGFNTFEPVNNRQAVAKYVTKYIGKNLSRSVTDVGAHLYYHSRGLNEKERIAEGTIYRDCSIPLSSSYENEKIIIREYEFTEENLAKLQQCFKYPVF